MTPWAELRLTNTRLEYRAPYPRLSVNSYVVSWLCLLLSSVVGVGAERQGHDCVRKTTATEDDDGRVN